ncbi:unnamed protein product [Brachionus calyciflorus]|uniref:Uncharacterized protein n=1 Tax=Brachionus calyciflorus TaxID=104777 RepID=A0A814KGW9_9BILA|nr:unnamed protein product [Brachionus calyciflorus]
MNKPSNTNSPREPDPNQARSKKSTPILKKSTIFPRPHQVRTLKSLKSSDKIVVTATVEETFPSEPEEIDEELDRLAAERDAKMEPQRSIPFVDWPVPPGAIIADENFVDNDGLLNHWILGYPDVRSVYSSDADEDSLHKPPQHSPERPQIIYREDDNSLPYESPS